MKMNISSQLRRDAVDFFTHLHPKAMWRVDLQKIVEALRLNLNVDETDRSVKTADGKENKETFVTLNFRKQYVKSTEGLIRWDNRSPDCAEDKINSERIHVQGVQ